MIPPAAASARTSTASRETTCSAASIGSAPTPHSHPSGREASREPASVEDPLLQLARKERIERVRAAVLSLPAHYREAVVLCDLAGLAYEDAATALGCAVGTVRSRLHRARELLLAKLSAQQEVVALPPVPARTAQGVS